MRSFHLRCHPWVYRKAGRPSLLHSALPGRPDTPGTRPRTEPHCPQNPAAKTPSKASWVSKERAPGRPRVLGEASSVFRLCDHTAANPASSGTNAPKEGSQCHSGLALASTVPGILPRGSVNTRVSVENEAGCEGNGPGPRGCISTPNVGGSNRSERGPVPEATAADARFLALGAAAEKTSGKGLSPGSGAEHAGRRPSPVGAVCASCPRQASALTRDPAGAAPLQEAPRADGGWRLKPEQLFRRASPK